MFSSDFEGYKAEKSDFEEEKQQYTVEAILNHRLNKNIMELLIFWKGFPKSAATWEPLKNLDCDELLFHYFEDKMKN